jgi:5-methylcytosine-specific restriction endonuclease McrA
VEPPGRGPGPRSRRRKARRKAAAAEATGPARCCPRCSAPVTEASGPRTYCSPRCRRSTQRQRRKARIRCGFVEPVSIGILRQRDADTCRICGQPVDAARKPPHPLAATIDHVVALVNGGQHGYANTQLAHQRCNTAKGAD